LRAKKRAKLGRHNSRETIMSRCEHCGVPLADDMVVVLGLGITLCDGCCPDDDDNDNTTEGDL